MHTYFGNMPAIQELWSCCDRFADIYEKRVGQKYSKAANDIYRRLTENGDEEKALLIAQRKFDQYLKDGYGLPSKMCPCTMVYELVGEIRNKTKKNKDD